MDRVQAAQLLNRWENVGKAPVSWPFRYSGSGMSTAPSKVLANSLDRIGISVRKCRHALRFDSSVGSYCVF